MAEAWRSHGSCVEEIRTGDDTGLRVVAESDGCVFTVEAFCPGLAENPEDGGLVLRRDSVGQYVIYQSLAGRYNQEDPGVREGKTGNVGCHSGGY